MSQGVVLDAASFDWGDLDCPEWRDVTRGWAVYDSTTPEALAERIASADIIVTNKVVLDAAALAQAPACRMIQAAATGVDHIDVMAAAAKGITVCHAKGYSTESVAQHALMLLLNLLTEFSHYHDVVRQGRWSESETFFYPGPAPIELQGLTVGIVGYGAIGQRFAELLRVFGADIQIAQRDSNDTRPGRIPLDELLATADVLSLHCPLTENTQAWLNAQRLGKMKPGALVLNVSRGGLIDEPALRAALDRGHIAGCGLDVLSVEPPASNHPLLDPPHPRCLVTPHVAWASPSARLELVRQMADNVRQFELGEPKRVITP